MFDKIKKERTEKLTVFQFILHHVLTRSELTLQPVRKTGYAKALTKLLQNHYWANR